MPRQPRRRAFEAFGTTVELVLWGTGERDIEGFRDLVRDRALRWEQSFSRFLPESDLCRANRAGGRWVRVSADFLSVVATARDAFVATDGRFDPAILPSLERAGYDRSFAQMSALANMSSRAKSAVEKQTGTVMDIELDTGAGAVRLPEGLRIDLGGIAKGAFVDSVDDLVRGYAGVIVDAGGDIRAWGRPGESGAWRIGVQHPGELDDDIAELELTVGGPVCVATSSTRTRTWHLGGERRNHLIDPRRQRPVPWSTPSVTVVADTVASAEVQAKAALVAIARGEAMAFCGASLVLVAHEDGRYETITPYATFA